MNDPIFYLCFWDSSKTKLKSGASLFTPTRKEKELNGLLESSSLRKKRI